jgi:methyltransferase
VYYLLILAISVERLVELIVSSATRDGLLPRAARSSAIRHYPAMVTLHVALLLGRVVEVWTLHQPFIAWLGWPMLTLVILSQALRWWCVTTQGRRWNTLVIVLPRAPLVRRGPYRWLHHPNYVAVVAEGIALPLVHTAWLTATCFTLANTLLLATRIKVENAALGYT